MSGAGNRAARANARRLRGTITRVEQNPYQFLPDLRLPRLAGGAALGYCQLASSLGPATGTWPTITPTTATGTTIYIGTGGASPGLTSIGTNLTVYNFLPETWDAGKTLELINSNGIWQIINEAC